MTLPTPFTADEIRTGCPDGRTVRVDDGAEAISVSRFLDGDLEGATIESWSEAADGVAVDEPSRSRVTWRQLQQHAAFPEVGTTVSRETIRTPLGEHDCLRYDVGDMTFWFDVGRPGMPVRYGGAEGWSTMIGDDRE